MGSCVPTGISAVLCRLGASVIALVACAQSHGGDRSASKAAPVPAKQAGERQSDSANTAPVLDISSGAITVERGARFAIELEANRTTPFEWMVDIVAGAENLALQNQSYLDKSSCADCVGGGGFERFDLHAKAAGRSTIRFRYVRVTDRQGPPAEQRDVNVVITE